MGIMKEIEIWQHENAITPCHDIESRIVKETINNTLEQVKEIVAEYIDEDDMEE